MAGLIDMAVTPNYSWPIPVATDLVKDGYEAIADLGDAIDTTVFGLGASSLTLINATTFTTQTTVTIDSLFSSTYQNYLMQLNLSTSGGTVSLTLRAAGVDQSSGYYGSSIGSNFSGGVASIVSQTNNASALAMFAQSANQASLWIYDANSATSRTIINGTYSEQGNYGAYVLGGARATATAHTGIKLTSASNMTGTIRLYGVRNS